MVSEEGESDCGSVFISIYLYLSIQIYRQIDKQIYLEKKKKDAFCGLYHCTKDSRSTDSYIHPWLSLSLSLLALYLSIQIDIDINIYIYMYLFIPLLQIAYYFSFVSLCCFCLVVVLHRRSFAIFIFGGTACSCCIRCCRMSSGEAVNRPPPLSLSLSPLSRYAIYHDPDQSN